MRGEHYFDDHFTQIPNAWLRDSRISFKARGLLGQILSNNINFQLSIRQLARSNKEGRDAIRSAIHELEEFGYLERIPGKQDHEEIWITKDPHRSENPTTPVGKSDHPRADNPTTKNTKKNNKENIWDLFEEFWKEYPKKASRGTAERAFKKALGQGKFEEILAGAIRYRQDPTRDDRFTMNPGTWLNAQAWLDEYEPSTGSVSAARREKELAFSESFLRDQEYARQNSTPPPLCEHGLTIVRCTVCIAKIQEENG